MPKSLKSRQVQPQGKHARFQETTIAFQLKENKRLVKESRIPCVPPNPTSPPVSPKRYVHSLVEPVFTLLSCGNAAISVLVNRMDLAWLSDHEGKRHSTACYRIVVFFSHSAQSDLTHTAWEEPLLYAFSWIRSKYCLGVTGQTVLGRALTKYTVCRMDIHSTALRR